jgi:hypothetical protein
MISAQILTIGRFDLQVPYLLLILLLHLVIKKWRSEG